MKELYWQLFAGVRAWDRRLQREREDRGGWIYNGHGRPLAIPDHRVKDLPNAFAQSTGHDSLLSFLWYIDQARRERGMSMRPWLVDFHDETIWTCPAGEVEAAKSTLEWALAKLNADLRAEIPLTGDVLVADSLWEIKR
jgi:hypothetical protein